PALQSISIDRHRQSGERLGDEIGNRAAIVWACAWAVGVEDSGDPDAQSFRAAEPEEKCLDASLALVVRGTRTDAIDRSEVGLGLRGHDRIAVDLGRRREAKKPAGFEQSKEIERSLYVRRNGPPGFRHVPLWGCRRSQVIDFIIDGAGTETLDIRL